MGNFKIGRLCLSVMSILFVLVSWVVLMIWSEWWDSFYFSFPSFWFLVHIISFISFYIFLNLIFSISIFPSFNWWSRLVYLTPIDVEDRDVVKVEECLCFYFSSIYNSFTLNWSFDYLNSFVSCFSLDSFNAFLYS